ncbi:hypothetical protein CYMTET_35602 [Cymbomonas tetramitiformis]|uniref:Uncharacterized protein n=1 Tax=Cymbomonas tetramitiformis TaxID=36881 RepID=A0AAE0F8P6_9CHLO|nr:hypothetical protein CYMTET_35602 [Cymbomonas tetramitiformis]
MSAVVVERTSQSDQTVPEQEQVTSFCHNCKYDKYLRKFVLSKSVNNENQDDSGVMFGRECEELQFCEELTQNWLVAEAAMNRAMSNTSLSPLERAKAMFDVPLEPSGDPLKLRRLLEAFAAYLDTLLESRWRPDESDASSVYAYLNDQQDSAFVRENSKMSVALQVLCDDKLRVYSSLRYLNKKLSRRVLRNFLRNKVKLGDEKLFVLELIEIYNKFEDDQDLLTEAFGLFEAKATEISGYTGLGEVVNLYNLFNGNEKVGEIVQRLFDYFTTEVDPTTHGYHDIHIYYSKADVNDEVFDRLLDGYLKSGRLSKPWVTRFYELFAEDRKRLDIVIDYYLKNCLINASDLSSLYFFCKHRSDPATFQKMANKFKEDVETKKVRITPFDAEFYKEMFKYMSETLKISLELPEFIDE